MTSEMTVSKKSLFMTVLAVAITVAFNYFALAWAAAIHQKTGSPFEFSNQTDQPVA